MAAGAFHGPAIAAPAPAADGGLPRRITDGPFADSKVIVAGVYILEAPGRDASLAIARTNPVVHDGGGVEIRPVHSGGVIEARRPAAG